MNQQHCITSSISASLSENIIGQKFSHCASRYNDIAEIQRQIAEQGLKNLPASLSGELLDIGCGTGLHTHALSQRGVKAQGVDIAKGMLDFAQKQYPAIAFSYGNAHKLPFSQGSFDWVFSSMALQWCNPPKQVACEIERVLTKTGKAELAIMVDGSFMQLHKARDLAGLPTAVTPLPAAQSWCSAFRSSGLKLARVITTDYVDNHSDILSLLRSIKGVGAGVTEQKNASLTKRDLKKLTMAYNGLSNANNTFPLTYRVCHFRLEKQ